MLGVLCNPLSGRVRKKLDAIRDLARTLPGAFYREATNAAEFHAALDEFAEKRLELLVIIAGDGTFHAVLSHLFGKQAFAIMPVLCPIPAGTTNMTAHDFGISAKPVQLLRSLAPLLADWPAGKLIERPVLKVVQAGGRPLYGMFFGAGLIVEGVKFFKRNIQTRGITGEGASAIVILRYLFSLLFNSAAYGWPFSIRQNDDELVSGNYLLALASTLDRLLLGIKPYWGEEPAPIHTTVVRQARPGLWYKIPLLLAGCVRHLKKDHAYASHNLDTLAIRMSGDFIIDGEIYTAAAGGGAVQITAADTIKILVP